MNSTQSNSPKKNFLGRLASSPLYVKILLVVLVILVVLVLLFGKTFMRRRRYGSGRSKRMRHRSYRGRRF